MRGLADGRLEPNPRRQPIQRRSNKSLRVAPDLPIETRIRVRAPTALECVCVGAAVEEAGRDAQVGDLVAGAVWSGIASVLDVIHRR